MRTPKTSWRSTGRERPIFRFSDLGIVGDLNKIMPKLTEAIKAKKGYRSGIRPGASSFPGPGFHPG